jgi:DNA-binding CsgD family transcriptional regulator
MPRELFAPDASGPIQSVIDDGFEKMRQIGVTAGGYFLTPAFHSPLSTKTAVASFGLDSEAEAFLTDPAFLADDPFPDYVMTAARPMTWHEVLADVSLTDSQRAFVDFLEEHGLRDALSVPLFGPNGCHSYSVYIFDRMIEASDAPMLKRIAEIAHAMHIDVCTAAAKGGPYNPSISRRESEVLRWMAHGKSNADIATILGLAPATIDTFVRRIFTKLKVNDRISAVLAGLSRGILQL